MFQYCDVTNGMFIIWNGMFRLSNVAVAPPLRHTAMEAAGFPDIFAPFEKHINREEFKIEVKDYSYIINDNKLIVYFVISLSGFKENDLNENMPTNTKEELLENINTLNETISENVENRNSKDSDSVKIDEIVSTNNSITYQNNIYYENKLTLT